MGTCHKVKPKGALEEENEERERERERERDTIQSLNILACNWSIPPPSLVMYVSCI